MTKLSLEHANSVTGLVPAAGFGSRLPGLSGSKEMLPVPDPDRPGKLAAIEFGLRFLENCGITQHHVVTAPTKSDLRHFLQTRDCKGPRPSCSEVANSQSVPHSLDAAYRSVASKTVVLVFPDIMFEPRAAIASVLSGFSPTDCDALLPVVPSSRGDKVDLVTIDHSGKVERIAPKPGNGQTGWTWVAAAWSPVFTDFLHGFLDDSSRGRRAPSHRELYVGDVINAAIDAGLCVRAERFDDGGSIDIGTPDEYAELWRYYGRQPPDEVCAILRNDG